MGAEEDFLRDDPEHVTYAQSPLHAAAKGLFERLRLGATGEPQRKYASEEELLQLYTSPEVQKLPVEERLPAVFKVPKTIRLYDIGRPLLSVAVFHGSALQLCLLRLEFWLLLAFHVVVAALYFGAFHHVAYLDTNVKGVPTAENWPAASNTLVAIPGSLIVFGLVFYVSRTYTRYSAQYSHVKGSGATLYELVGYLRHQFPDAAFEEAPRLRRHLTNLLNAAHLLGYAGLPQNRAAGIPVWAFDYCLDKQLLTPAQAEYLRKLLLASDGRMAFKEILLWVSSGVWTQVDKGRSIRMGTARDFHERLLLFRDHLDAAYSYTTGPVPFAYYHHLNLITLIYLFMLAYLFVFLAPWMSIPGYTLILMGVLSLREIGNIMRWVPWMSIPGYALILMGVLSLREIANIMSDPLGDDEFDLPVFELVLGGVRVTSKVVDLPPQTAPLHPFGSPKP